MKKIDMKRELSTNEIIVLLLSVALVSLLMQLFEVTLLTIITAIGIVIIPK